MKLSVCLFVFASCAVQAQVLTIPKALDKLAAKADEVVDVNLDPAMMGLASKFMSDKDPDEAKAKKMITGFKGIFVRSYEFAKEGEYAEADIEPLRTQLRAPDWSCVVNVQSRKSRENAQVCFHRGPNNTYDGLAVVAAEPKQLTIVSISGVIDPEQIGALEGQFGIPKITGESKAKPAAPAK
jgi:hypothetical protein